MQGYLLALDDLLLDVDEATDMETLLLKIHLSHRSASDTLVSINGILRDKD